ncbi:hypothetical protein MHY87_18265 [Microvirga sp. ACRRW]|uniref:hypothetical protein n=1 Tax=Microvirga sp. ACRRW TaxID=2918205 RepID=UPI001EF616A4|nr:hypothetical protein [Microvirga sp. ACRRW]MCG7394848.1 hypothetical protein [Microvirga sp. ACRRW]
MNENFSATELLQRAHALSKKLEDAEIWNEIRFFRKDGITVLARVPGEYWEIDLLEDGTTDVEVLRSTGDLEDETSIERLISEFSEKPKH